MSQRPETTLMEGEVASLLNSSETEADQQVGTLSPDQKKSLIDAWNASDQVVDVAITWADAQGNELAHDVQVSLRALQKTLNYMSTSSRDARVKYAIMANQFSRVVVDAYNARNSQQAQTSI